MYKGGSEWNQTEKDIGSISADRKPGISTSKHHSK
jgi:hypothetical protein